MSFRTRPRLLIVVGKSSSPSSVSSLYITVLWPRLRVFRECLSWNDFLKGDWDLLLELDLCFTFLVRIFGEFELCDISVLSLSSSVALSQSVDESDLDDDDDDDDDEELPDSEDETFRLCRALVLGRDVLSSSVYTMKSPLSTSVELLSLNRDFVDFFYSLWGIFLVTDRVVLPLGLCGIILSECNDTSDNVFSLSNSVSLLLSKELEELLLRRGSFERLFGRPRPLAPACPLTGLLPFSAT